jgi:transketolase
MNNLENLAKLIRYYILVATTAAKSGHVTSSLSAVELMTALFFKHFHYDLNNPHNPNNDHLIFSKGHASPLFYALLAAAGKITEHELLSLRHFNSQLEGHPSMRFAYTEAPTGSLGQGLSIGLGIALHEKKMEDKPNNVYVLLGDGEMVEGQVWEAIQLASYYKLNNLYGILDVNRLGQSGPTMLGTDIAAYERRLQSFGWRTYLLPDGNDINSVDLAYEYLLEEIPNDNAPCMLIAKTIKGKGVSFLEDKEGWHGKALSGKEFEEAVGELGKINKDLMGEVTKSSAISKSASVVNSGKAKQITNYKVGDLTSTRKALGTGLVRLGKMYPDIVVLDADVKNSTYTIDFENVFPDRFFQMYIAEQNMVSVAVGLASRGKIPVVSTFAAFLTRACDQIRMAELAEDHIIFIGSHAGTSIGEDGPSQMGLQDIAMFRSGLGTSVLYPADAVAMERLLETAYKANSIVYIRSTRGETPIIYRNTEKFPLGGSKTLRTSPNDLVTVIAAGITLFEALEAADKLAKEGIEIRVIDLYSIKPIDKNTILKAANETKAIITVEDHYSVGGLGDAVLEVLGMAGLNPAKAIYKMAVTKVPRSGKPEELLDYEDIYAKDIINRVKSILNTS